MFESHVCRWIHTTCLQVGQTNIEQAGGNGSIAPLFPLPLNTQREQTPTITPTVMECYKLVSVHRSNKKGIALNPGETCSWVHASIYCTNLKFASSINHGSSEEKDHYYLLRWLNDTTRICGNEITIVLLGPLFTSVTVITQTISNHLVYTIMA